MRKKKLREYQNPLRGRGPKYAYEAKSSKAKALGPRKGLGIFLLAAFFTIILYAFFTGNKSVLKLYSLHQYRNELITEQERLTAENKKLEGEIQKLQTDKRYIEEVARTKYNFKKKNEEVLRIKPE